MNRTLASHAVVGATTTTKILSRTGISCTMVCTIVCNIALSVLAGGCMKNVAPGEARAQFSSKDQSVNAPSAPTTANQRADGMPTLSTTAGTPGTFTVPVDASEVEAAQALLRSAARSNWAALRAHAIEASSKSPALLEEFAVRGLVDENRGVRFVTCMAIAHVGETMSQTGRAKFVESVQPLLLDESLSVQASAMLALTRCGLAVDVSPLALMIGNDDPEIRANAYLVLGELGNPSAVPLIRESLGHGMKLVNPIRVRLVDLAAAEALVKLGAEDDIVPIRAALFAPPEQAELTVVACDAIGRLHDQVARPMLERILSAPGAAARSPEIRLAAARALMRLGSNPLMGVAIAREYAASPDPRIRAQVASLVGGILALPTAPSEAVDLARVFLRDTDPTVQVAAASALEPAE